MILKSPITSLYQNVFISFVPGYSLEHGEKTMVSQSLGRCIGKKVAGMTCGELGDPEQVMSKEVGTRDQRRSLQGVLECKYVTEPWVRE